MWRERERGKEGAEHRKRRNIFICNKIMRKKRKENKYKETNDCIRDRSRPTTSSPPFSHSVSANVCECALFYVLLLSSSTRIGLPVYLFSPFRAHTHCVRVFTNYVLIFISLRALSLSHSLSLSLRIKYWNISSVLFGSCWYIAAILFCTTFMMMMTAMFDACR